MIVEYPLRAVSYHAGIVPLCGPLTLRRIFTHAWQLQSPDGWIITVAALPYNGPLAIRVAQLDSRNLCPTMSATLRPDALTVGPIRVTLQGAIPWQPHPPDHAVPILPAALTADIQRLSARDRGASSAGRRGDSHGVGVNRIHPSPGHHHVHCDQHVRSSVTVGREQPAISGERMNAIHPYAPDHEATARVQTRAATHKADVRTGAPSLSARSRPLCEQNPVGEGFSPPRGYDRHLSTSQDKRVGVLEDGVPLAAELRAKALAYIVPSAKSARKGGQRRSSSPYADPLGEKGRYGHSAYLLAEALALGDVVGMQEAALSLLGLGPGLTPSGDDLLCGLLAGLFVMGRRLPRHRAWAERVRSDLGEIVDEMAPSRTTALSRTLLHWAAQGVVAEPLRDVLCTLGSGSAVRGLPELLGIGHHSGADLLAGALLAAGAVLEQEEASGEALARAAECLL